MQSEMSTGNVLIYESRAPGHVPYGDLELGKHQNMMMVKASEEMRSLERGCIEYERAKEKTFWTINIQ